MDNEKVYTPETIEENPLPIEVDTVSQSVSDSSESTSETKTPSSMQTLPVPRKRFADELLSEKLNTRTKKILAEFTFTPSGAIQIGNYQDGDTGDIRISPDGIVARDSYGNVTFALDGESGDAVFKGQITAGSILTGLIYVGDESGNIVIDGANKRIVVNDGTNDRILIGYGQGLF